MLWRGISRRGGVSIKRLGKRSVTRFMLSGTRLLYLYVTRRKGEWCNFIQFYRQLAILLNTSPQAVGPSEHAQIEKRIDKWAEDLAVRAIISRRPTSIASQAHPLSLSLVFGIRSGNAQEPRSTASTILRFSFFNPSSTLCFRLLNVLPHYLCECE